MLFNRAEFIASAAAFAAFAQVQGDVTDPAMNSATQALRVLLGPGDARQLDAQTFLFDGRRYRGTFSRTPDTNEIVSAVPLEEYLYSVVSREMPHSWPGAALQTQAIVARTYVLQRSNPTRSYDLVPSQADQVYTGMDAERPETSSAVDATAGQVLRFGNAFARIEYSSCCGGHTESSQNAWGGMPIPYLEGVACPYCTESPWYRWSARVSTQDLRARLGDRIAPVGNVRGIVPDPPDRSGRSLFWTIDGDAGSVRLKAADVRQSLGTRALPSLLVHKVALDDPPAQADRSITIEGAGLGHGVGLCQWGARGMALGGADAKAILAFYYPRTGIGHD